MYYYKQVCIDPICPWVFAYACVYLHHRFLKVNWIFWATDVWDLNSKVVSINIHVHSCKTHVSFKKIFIVIFYLFYLKGWVTEGERFSVHCFIVQMVTIPWAEKPGWSEEPGTPSVFPMWAAGTWALGHLLLSCQTEWRVLNQKQRHQALNSCSIGEVSVICSSLTRCTTVLAPEFLVISSPLDDLRWILTHLVGGKVEQVGSSLLSIFKKRFLF